MCSYIVRSILLILKMKAQDTLMLFLFLGFVTNHTQGQGGLPSYIIPCYRTNNTQNMVAQSEQVFLQLIRKIEDSVSSGIDIRRLSASLFHQLRIDGIQKAVGVSETEFVTPYRNNGIMAPKLELLKRLIPFSETVAFQDILTEAELCILHKMISNSIEPFERGDETRTCPTYSRPSVDAPWITGNIKAINETFRVGYGHNTRNVVKFGRGVSKCPIEMGVARSEYYGDFTLGTLIGAIAAGLAPQRVQINELIETYRGRANLEKLDDQQSLSTNRQFGKLLRNLNSIDNKYAAGLAGDLAEVCVYQTPYLGSNFKLATKGVWNNTLFPRVRLVEENHGARWEFTEAEIMAGIDSFFISKSVHEWVNQLRRLRLSQIVEMYYSARGIPVRSIETMAQKPKHFGHLEAEDISKIDGITSACDRMRILDAIDVTQLKEQTFEMAQVLQFTTSSFFISEEKLRGQCDIAVEMFFEMARKLLNNQLKCNNIPKTSQFSVVDLQLVIDGSRREYESLELINHIAHLSKMSSYGTQLTVIHGSSGEILANRTNNIVSTFEQLRTSGRYPTTIHLSSSLQTILRTLHNQTVREQLERRICAPSHVILIMCQGSRIGQSDYESAQRIISTSMQRFPDLYFIFVTNDKQTFVDLTKAATVPTHWAGNVERYNELIYPEHFVVIETRSTDPVEFSESLAKELRRIPKRIIAPFCLHEGYSEQLLRENILFRPDEYEDFVGPNQEIVYRISPFYFRHSPFISLQFHGVDYGDLTICQSRTLNRGPDSCQNLKGFDMIWFNTTRPCDSMDCASIYFSVSLDQSRMRCSENACRYPDQVRYIIRHLGLTCENDPNRAPAIDNTGTGVMCLLSIVVMKFLARF